MDHGSSTAARPQNHMKKLHTSLKPSTNKGGSEALRARSLAVFGSAEEAVYSDLLKCKLLRVLDLKECNDSLSQRHNDYIYNLLHLKYPTLGKSVSELDDKMKNLHCLETLDLRKTKIEELPVEVIRLPHLAHLFGKIKLQNIRSQNREKFPGDESNLETLAGVVVDNNSSFPELMGHTKKLKKVKIWCEITSTDSTNYRKLSKAIQKYSSDGLNTLNVSRCLSLHLNDSSIDLLNHHQGGNANAPSTEPMLFGYLSSLKLHGIQSQFEFCNSICGLEELCLTYTNLKRPGLPALRVLQRLVCLKLVQDNLEDLHINPEDFQSLQRLCLVVKEPIFPTIAEKALPSLTSIQLLCGSLEGLGGIEMENFEALCEVALDSRVTRETIQLWEDKANRHPNKRPKIVLLKRVDQDDNRSAVKYVATDQISSDP